jgi:phospholipid/cholesterol/gamma-HCH transport system ATP-binding protein
MTLPAVKISMKQINKSFGTKKVLRNLDLDVVEGKSLVIIGGSGTGKSVMIKSILGLLKPDSGTIEVDGKNTKGLRGAARDSLMDQFGMLFQGGALFDSLKVWENVAFRLINAQKMRRGPAHEIAIEKLKAVGLGAHVGELYPAELSGGMQKRVSLARAIAANPKVIFFDEPTTGLDPIMADVINDLIVKCVRDLGATALSITHDMASVRKIADEVAMIYEGKIVWRGDVADLDHSGNPYVDQFIHGRGEGPIRFV